MKKLSYIQNGTRAVKANYFAVPNENSAAGAVTGIKVFREILEAMKAEGCSHAADFVPMMHHLCNAMDEQGTKSRAGAARAIVRLLEDCLFFMATRSEFDAWLDGRLKSALGTLAFMTEMEAEQNAAFVARMKAARAAAVLQRACAESVLNVEA